MPSFLGKSYILKCTKYVGSWFLSSWINFCTLVGWLESSWNLVVNLSYQGSSWVLIKCVERNISSSQKNLLRTFFFNGHWRKSPFSLSFSLLAANNVARASDWSCQSNLPKLDTAFPFVIFLYLSSSLSFYFSLSLSLIWSLSISF